MAKLQVIPTMLPNKGLVLSKPEEFLKNQFSTGESCNMEFYNELLQGRLGLTKFDAVGTGAAIELSGPITLVDQFWKFSGSWFLLFATTKDIFSYNLPSGTGPAAYYDIITPVYKTGTVSVGTGPAVAIVYGAGGADFTVGAIKAGDFIKLGTGSPTTLDAWYKVLTKDSATQLTLTTAGPVTTGSGYTIRKCFTGSSTDFWRARTFIDKNLGDTWIAVNGVDPLMKWHGTGAMTALTMGATGLTTAKFVEVYKDRVIVLWTVEGGNQPQRERWSAVADCMTWNALDFRDFMEDGYWITGTGIMSSSHVVFRERDAQIGRYVGGDYTFDYEASTSCFGVWAPNSLVLVGREAYYYGPDNKFHRWDMLSDKIISESIFPHTKDFNPNLESYIFGREVEGKNQIRWFVPFSDTLYNNECVVYDYAEDIIQIWEYEQAQACCSIGEYLNIVDLYLDDVVWGDYYMDEHEGFFDDRTFLSGAPQVIYGGYDGYVRKADLGINDDGTAYNRIFESIRNNHKLPHINKRLWKQQHWLQSETSGNVTIKLKKDDSLSFEVETKTMSLINAGRDIIKENVTWNKQAENFKTRIEATNHFALLGYLDYIFAKGKTVR